MTYLPDVECVNGIAVSDPEKALSIVRPAEGKPPQTDVGCVSFYGGGDNVG